MSSDASDRPLKWYEGITGYQWLVLVVASLGWVFDIFEGQIFVASMREAMPQLLGAESADTPIVQTWNNYALASFLLGGGGPPPDAMGGVMADIANWIPLTHVIRAIQEPWLAIGSPADHQLIVGCILAAAVACIVATRTRDL